MWREDSLKTKISKSIERLIEYIKIVAEYFPANLLSPPVDITYCKMFKYLWFQTKPRHMLKITSYHQPLAPEIVPPLIYAACRAES